MITSFTYDDLDRTETVTDSAGKLVTYAYDPVGRRTGMTDPDGGRFTYTYDAAGRLETVVNPQGERTTFSYDGADRLLVKQLANGTRTSHVYDDDGRLEQIRHFKGTNVVLDGLTYVYNNVGVRTGQAEAGGEMAMWTSPDKGQTWTLVRQLTHDSPRNHTYARRPVNAHHDFYALWADGDARKPSESHLYFSDKDGAAYKLPRKMSGPTAKPELVHASVGK